jgi:hypothetical protein
VEDGWQEVADNLDDPADEKIVSGPVVAIILKKLGAFSLKRDSGSPKK